MKLLVVNGVNLNMLGIREPHIYGDNNYYDLVKYVEKYCKEKDVFVECVQSNSEGAIVNFIQQAYFDEVDGIIINAGAYTHTSIAILDALKSVNIPTVEVHLSDLSKREDFRQKSYISLYAQKIICGFGFEGYLMAIDYLIGNMKNKTQKSESE